MLLISDLHVLFLNSYMYLNKLQLIAFMSLNCSEKSI